MNVFPQTCAGSSSFEVGLIQCQTGSLAFLTPIVRDRVDHEEIYEREQDNRQGRRLSILVVERISFR